jgi:hypothetical protein
MNAARTANSPSINFTQETGLKMTPIDLGEAITEKLESLKHAGPEGQTKLAWAMMHIGAILDVLLESGSEGVKIDGRPAVHETCNTLQYDLRCAEAAMKKVQAALQGGDSAILKDFTGIGVVSREGLDKDKPVLPNELQVVGQVLLGQGYDVDLKLLGRLNGMCDLVISKTGSAKAPTQIEETE